MVWITNFTMISLAQQHICILELHDDHLPGHIYCCRNFCISYSCTLLPLKPIVSVPVLLKYTDHQIIQSPTIFHWKGSSRQNEAATFHALATNPGVLNNGSKTLRQSSTLHDSSAPATATPLTRKVGVPTTPLEDPYFKPTIKKMVGINLHSNHIKV